MTKALLRTGIACLIGLTSIGFSIAQQCDGIWLSVAADEHRCLRPGVGERFKDCFDCPEMVVVPAGTFTMGSPPDEPQRERATEDQAPVTIPTPLATAPFSV